jgi:signal transduction histidine kinase
MIQGQGASMQERGALARRGLRGRELRVVGDIAHALLHASRPVEVYRLALERVTPLVGARFGSVFLRDPADPTLLKLECVHNWPQFAARFLSQMRIREGQGPTGRAVAERTAVVVEDLFSDPSHHEWWEPARELGFASLVSLPFADGGIVKGALTLYFGRPRGFTHDERRLLAVIADQLAVTASRAELLNELSNANERLRAHNGELALRAERSEELRRLKDELIANVSHELRTPLTTIIGYAQLLADGELGAMPELQSNALRRIESAGSSLLALITDLLDLSQLRTARVPMTTGRYDAAALARAASEETPVPHGRIRFELRSPEEPVRIDTDGEKVVRILKNLLSNAFKFTPEGAVSLEVAARGSMVTWTVRDTGIGICDTQLDRIFDEFSQVDGSTTRLYGGAGLGLALSRRLAVLLGGDIRVESATGTGSTFVLSLPIEGEAENDEGEKAERESRN